MDQGTPRPTSVAVLANSMVLGSVGLLIFGVQPAMLGAFVVEGRSPEAGVGAIVTAELLSMAIGSVIGARILRTASPRMVAALAAIAFALVNAAMLQRHGLPTLLGMRAAAGLAEGILVSIPAVAIAQARRPERASAIFLVAQTLLQLAVATSLPLIVVRGSPGDGVLATMAAGGAIAAMFAIGTPRVLRPAPTEESTHGTLTPGALPALIAAGGYLGAIIVVWSYFGLWLHHLGTPATVEPTAIGISLGFQIIGALAAARWSDRLSNRAVLLAAALGEAGLVIALLLDSGRISTVYLFSAAFGFIWQFAAPSFTGLLIEVDPRRRAVLFLPAAQLIGAAALPLVAGSAVAWSGVIGAMMLAATILSGTAVLLAITHRRRNTSGVTLA